MSRFGFSFVFILSSVVLSACGGHDGPIADRPVVELEDVPESPAVQTIKLPKNPPTTLLQKVVSQGVDEALAKLTFSKYDQFSSRVKNTRYLSIVDFNQRSTVPRLHVVNLTSGDVETVLVAHGRGSDPKNTGFAETFGNVPSSGKSSLGAYLVAEKYRSPKHGMAMRMDGLEATNDMARRRAIVMHSAKYIDPDRSSQGRSLGCPAVPIEWIGRALDRLANGSLLYAYSNIQSSQMELWNDHDQIQKMLLDPSFHWLDESEAEVGD